MQQNEQDRRMHLRWKNTCGCSSPMRVDIRLIWRPPHPAGAVLPPALCRTITLLAFPVFFQVNRDGCAARRKQSIPSILSNFPNHHPIRPNCPMLGIRQKISQFICQNFPNSHLIRWILRLFQSGTFYTICQSLSYRRQAASCQFGAL